MHQPLPGDNGEHVWKDALYTDAKQPEEWNKEMPEDDDQAYVPPTALLAHNVPESFLRHVRIPDNEILRESYVRVEYGKCEHQGADEIILVLVQHFGEHSLPIEDSGDD